MLISVDIMENTKNRLSAIVFAGLFGLGALVGNIGDAEAKEGRVKHLSNAMKAYAYDNGYLPNKMNELVKNGYLKEIPKDRHGNNYRIKYWRSGRFVVAIEDPKNKNDNRVIAVVYDKPIIGTDKWSSRQKKPYSHLYKPYKHQAREIRKTK